MIKRWLGLSPYPLLDRATMSWRSAFIGLSLNLILFAGKLVVGIFINSVAFISDSFNNLTDSLSVLVMLIGMKFSQRGPDHDHPHGHGRGEYVTTFLIGILIALLGVQLIFSSIDRILNPVTVTWSISSLLILFASIIFKSYLYHMNRQLHHRYHSNPHRATAQDSLNDIGVTAGVLISLLITHYMAISLDGIVGLMIAGFILMSAYRISQHAIQSLLGMGLSADKSNAIETRILTAPGVRGVHRLESHDYGPDRMLATIHVEVDDSMSLVDAHHLIDGIEAMVEKEFGIHLLIHLDPISSNTELYEQITRKLLSILHELDQTARIGELRIIEGAVMTDIVMKWYTSIDGRMHTRLRTDFYQGIQKKYPTYTVSLSIVEY